MIITTLDHTYSKNGQYVCKNKICGREMGAGRRFLGHIGLSLLKRRKSWTNQDKLVISGKAHILGNYYVLNTVPDSFTELNLFNLYNNPIRK